MPQANVALQPEYRGEQVPGPGDQPRKRELRGDEAHHGLVPTKLAGRATSERTAAR